jgi:Glyoxalase-like domain
MAIPVQVAFDCRNPEQLARFWMAVLHYKVQDPPSGFASWEAFLETQQFPDAAWGDFFAIVDPEQKGPRIYFQRVPESKIVKNRLHLDVNVSTEVPEAEARAHVEATAQRLTALGAQEIYRPDEDNEFWITMTDPEGNEFCIQ